MYIKEVSIKNFRSIQNLSASFNELVAICGSNSVGKSNVLRALKFALRYDHSLQKVRENICLFVAGPRTTIEIRLVFSEPTPTIAKHHSLKKKESFTFALKATRGGSVTALINGEKLSKEDHLRFVDCITIVDVPAVRDIENEGLKPFKQTLAKVLLKTKGKDSYTKASAQFRKVVEDKGYGLLNQDSGSLSVALDVDDIAIDTSLLNFDLLLAQTALKVKTRGNYVNLSKLGTGHQSTVVLHLYKQLGSLTDDFVLYLFEEPDNHLHPSSMRAAATNFIETAREGRSQVFLTTHSPRLLNQFDFDSILALKQGINSGATEKRNFDIAYPDKALRELLGKYGLTPAESLLCKKVILVEGRMDVNALRSFIEASGGKTADQLDILVIPCNGKSGVSELAVLCKSLCVECICVFDYDATENNHQPSFSEDTRSSKGSDLITGIQTIIDSLEQNGVKKSRTQKNLESMINELQNGYQNTSGFEASSLGKLIDDNKLLSATKLTDLKKAIRHRQTKLIKDILEKVNVILWKGTIEDVIMGDKDDLGHVEYVLEKNNKVSLQTGGQRKATISKGLKKLAHDPVVVRDVIGHTWAKSSYKRSEVKRALRLILK